jgi:hypothetical protein
VPAPARGRGAEGRCSALSAEGALRVQVALESFIVGELEVGSIAASLHPEQTQREMLERLLVEFDYEAKRVLEQVLCAA